MPNKELEKLCKGLQKFPNVLYFLTKFTVEFYFDKQRHHSLLEFSEIRDRVIVLDGWSKLIQ